MIRTLVKYLSFVAAFGRAKGTILFLHYRRDIRANGRQPAKEYSFSILPHRVSLRPGTTDWPVLDQIYIQRQYDVPGKLHRAAIASHIQRIKDSGKAPMIIDAGAYVGLSSVYFATTYPDCKVVAVEPENGNFAILRRNAAHYPNIATVRAGITGSSGHLGISNTGEEYAFQVTPSSGITDIPAFTIPDILAQFPGHAPVIVKIDVEGSERSIFDSADWLASVPAIFIETHDLQMPWQGCGHAVLKALATTPRDYLIAGENLMAIAPVPKQ